MMHKEAFITGEIGQEELVVRCTIEMGKNMDLDSKIYVAGHTGLVGSALVRSFKQQGYNNLLLKTHKQLDLLDQRAVHEFFDKEKPEYVFLAAAKVGGIHANNTYPADFISQNLAVQQHVIHESWKNGVKRLLFLGSSCIYPKECPQPMKEEYLLTGPLEPTNRPYAVAKIAGIEMCGAFNRQYNTRYLAVMPTNLYGPGDNYDLQNSHVLPAIIRKMHEAKVGGEKKVIAWGTGSPRREFLYSDDMADACIFLMNLPEDKYSVALRVQTSDLGYSLAPLINIGCGQDQTIRTLVNMVKDVVGFKGEIEWDSTKPDGTMQKLLDVSRLSAMGWKPATPLREGIEKAYRDYLLYIDKE